MGEPISEDQLEWERQVALLQKLLWVSSIATEILLLGAVSKRGAARNLPTFLLYVYWVALGDIAACFFYYSAAKNYAVFYDAQLASEGLILIAVLFDLARSALRPLPRTFSRGALAVLGVVTAGAGAIVWKFADSWALWTQYPRYHLFLREQLTFSLLRVLLLLLIGGLLQFLASHSIQLGWGESELQVATGMGIYALASLAESLVTTYQRFVTPSVFFSISFSTGVIYELCLIYWVVCFLRSGGDTGEAEAMPNPPRADSDRSTLWERESLVTPPGIGT